MPLAHRVVGLKLLAMLIAAFVLGGCGRSSLNPQYEFDASSDSSFDGPSSVCSSATCPTGCCTAEGTCVSGTSSAACGTSGEECVVCPTDESCSSGSRTCKAKGACTASTCPEGCCDSSDQCRSGTNLLACGSGGQACSNCQAEGFDACDPGTHQCERVQAECGPSTCPNGCCEQLGDVSECVEGTNDVACGTGGILCQQCFRTGLTCNSATHTCEPPTCDATTCPMGCCDTSGNCETGRSPEACGIGGRACLPCPEGDGCLDGACIGVTCNPATCSDGCCDSAGRCEPGNSPLSCGTGASACLPCPPGDSCSAGVCKGPSCGPSTCPTGCCDALGFCETGTSPHACGEGGESCSVCSSGDVCSGGNCEPAPCGPATCPMGCCNAAGLCQPGGSTLSCGNGGKACMPCPPGDTCNAGACQGATCNSTNCATGCCDGFGECETGTSVTACGTDGNACLPCPPGDSCTEGVCKGAACSPSTCPSGCCDALGFCESGTTVGECGKGGAACTPCPSGDSCNSGTCQASTCNATTCPAGCCDGAGNCQTGVTLNDCGTGGKACAACPSGDACVGGTCQGATCSFSTCPNGCCDQNDVCQPGDSISDCGSGGSLCVTCSGKRASCDEGSCNRSRCDATTCPTGCCDSSGECQPGNQTFNCGTGGSFCANCDFDQLCEGGTCATTPCNPDTCMGCCDEDNNCQPGTTNAACGEFGTQCSSCPSSGFCLDGTCGGFVCNAATCPDGCCDGEGNCQTGLGLTGGSVCPCSLVCSGCCDSTNNCHAGTVSTECGSNGASCVDCTALGETCDDFTFPVVCDMSCPAPYPGCATGTTMPAPTVAPGACHSFDLTDAATACVAGAQTVDCQNFFSAEFGVNANCANCLTQFDVDFVDLTGIYLCAEPIVSASCDTFTGCASDCLNVACAACEETTCDSTAIAGECSSFVDSGNACIAASPAANALCAQSSYPNFGAWLAGVGAKYCE